MTDSRGTLVSIDSMDAIYFPHLAGALEPVLGGDFRLIWHCDGNIMPMVPRLLEIGIEGFQGFQYEDGVDYPALCGAQTRSGRKPFIWAGASVTRTLPAGTPAEVRAELDFLVTHASGCDLALGLSSSLAPGVPMENLRALLEGLAFYRQRT